MRLRAYAKLNLSLRVHGLRADGFHEIESLVQTIDLCDELELALTDSGVEVDNDLGLSVAEDLAARAAGLLLSEKKADRGVRVVVRKGIPVGMGLGGGSSDAAAVLRGLDRLLPPVLPRARLAALGAQLGSDVPLFLTGGRLRIAGRGEQVAALLPATERFLVLLPPISCATRAVYQAYDRLPRAGTAAALCAGENDLWPAAHAAYPELARYDAAMRTLPAVYAGMSGSGAAFYAAFTTEDAARAAEETLSASLPEARVVLCGSTCAGQTVDEGDG